MTFATPLVGHRRAILLIVGVWAGWLATLALLGWLGQGTGLMVWPMGEDRNWINLLLKRSVGQTVRGFWQIDYRNPLSPWWYVAFKPLIMGWPQGLFMLRNLVGLALALSSYALIVTWAGAAARSFAIAVACLIAIFTANAFFDQIYWNFQAALLCSILCVTCYLRHLRAPVSGQWLTAALVLWLAAIVTYTIQTGAIVAIAYAAWHHAGTDSPGPHPIRQWLRRASSAALAIWPFAAVLLIFILIWQTSSIPAGSFIGAPSLQRLFDSLQAGLWHPDSTLMAQVLAISPHRPAYLLVGALVCAVAFLALRAPTVSRARLLGLLLLVGGLTVPTLFVETVGTQWLPGSRWRMMYQFTTPALYLIILGLAASLLPRGIGGSLWRGAVAVCFGLAATASLAHNERQVSLTASERDLRRVIAADAASQTLSGARPLHYLVMLDDRSRWFALDVLSPIYAKSWFPGQPIEFRLVPSTGIYSGLQQGAVVAFQEDADGVANATLDGRTIPYSQVRIVRARSGAFEIVNRLRHEDLAGLRAQWQRSGPVTLAPCQPATPDCR